MAEKTQRFNIPYPSKGQDNYYETFVSMVNRIDSLEFSSFDQANQFVFGGGTITWENSVLSWTSEISLISPTFGTKQSLVRSSEINSNGLTIPIGHFLQYDVSRGGTLSISIDEVTISSQIDIDRASQPLCYHDSSGKLVFITGLVLDNGSSVVGLGNGGSGGGSSDYLLLSSDESLENSRTLVVTNDISLTDFGAGNNAQLGLADLPSDPSGTYSHPRLTVDSKGRVTSITEGSPNEYPDIVVNQSASEAYHSSLNGFELPSDNVLGLELETFDAANRNFYMTRRKYVSSNTGLNTVTMSYCIRAPIGHVGQINIAGGAIYIDCSDYDLFTFFVTLRDTRGTSKLGVFTNADGKLSINSGFLVGSVFDDDSFFTIEVEARVNGASEEIGFGDIEFYFDQNPILPNFPDIVVTSYPSNGSLDYQSSSGIDISNDILGLDILSYSEGSGNSLREFIMPVKSFYSSSNTYADVDFMFCIKTPLDVTTNGISGEFASVYLDLSSATSNILLKVRDSEGVFHTHSPTALVGFNKYVIPTSALNSPTLAEDSHFNIIVSVRLNSLGDLLRIGNTEVYFSA